MRTKAGERGRVPWIAALALLALVAGLWTAIANWRPARAPRSDAPAAPGEPAGDVVAQALDQAADSAAIRARWVDEVKGVALDGLDDRQRELFIRFANAERCTCGCGYTLAGCRSYDPTCEISLPLAEALLDSVRRGRIRSAKGLRERPPG